MDMYRGYEMQYFQSVISRVQHSSALIYACAVQGTVAARRREE